MKFLRKLFGGKQNDIHNTATTYQQTEDAPIYLSNNQKLPKEELTRIVRCDLYSELDKIGDNDRKLKLIDRALELIDEGESLEVTKSYLINKRALILGDSKSLQDAIILIENDLHELESEKQWERAKICKKTLDMFQKILREAIIQEGGGEKAEILNKIKRLNFTGDERLAVFDELLAYWVHEDRDIRLFARKNAQYAFGIFDIAKTIWKAQESDNLRKIGLAGRLLGYLVVSDQETIVHSQTAEMIIGESIAFIPVTCSYCGYLNGGVPCPPMGPMNAYYHSTLPEGEYVVSVLCDDCGKEFYTVWDTNLI